MPTLAAETYPSPCLPREAWVDQFANELGRLLPKISAAEATRRADKRFEIQKDSPPIEAAGLYLADMEPDDTGADEWETPDDRPIALGLPATGQPHPIDATPAESQPSTLHPVSRR